jgi:suppressor of ftsI
MSSPARPSRVVAKLPRRRSPRRTRLGRGRRPLAGWAAPRGSFSAEQLEPRLLLAAENLLAPDVAAYPNQLQPFAEPPIISSRDGVLEARVRLVSAGSDSNPIRYGTEDLFSGNTTDDATDQQIAAMAYQFDAYGTSYPAAFPGPTLQLNPGDTLKLSITNDLSTNLDGNELATNFHFHGGHVPAMGQGDNVYRSLGPGETMEVVIPVPAETQSAGMNWYHPHHHMSTHVQVYGGLAGTIQIGDTLDAWPQYKGVFTEQTLALSEVNIQDGKIERLGTSDGFMVGWQKRVNGQLNPTMTMRPGETRIWNLANIGSRGLFNLALTDENLENPWQATILAVDGNETDMRPLPLSLSADPLRMQNALAPTAIPGGGRLAMAVTAPTEPGTYYLIDGWGGDEFNGRFGTNVVPPPGPPPPFTLADAVNFWNSPPPVQGYFKLATIEVAGDPINVPPPVFPVQPPSPMFTAEADVTREVIFDLIGDTEQEQVDNALADIFGINGKSFGETITPLVEIGTVEEWTIRNETVITHSFHIHQGKFTVVAVNGEAVDPFAAAGTGEQTYISEMDVVMVPPGESVTIRFGVENFPGNYVFHCHVLPHEDQGMMATVRAVSPTAGLRTAVSDLAASADPVMRIINSRSQTAAVIEPFADLGYAGTLVTSSTFDRAAVVQTVAVGTGENTSLVRLYDDVGAPATTQFAAFDDDAGVSLSIGSISTDGSAVVAAGSRAPGSRVRLFDTEGNLLREFADVLAGEFPNGVNVTAQDINGDNFADLIVSGRAGGPPLITALDGEDIATGEAEPARLFTFTAGGGETAGAKVALAYNDMPTQGTYMPKIITTPEQGPLAGTVQVWDPTDFVPYHSHTFDGSDTGGHTGGHMGHVGSSMPSSGMDSMPMPIVEFQPFAGGDGPVELTTSYLPQEDQAPVLPVILNWQTDDVVAYTSITATGEAVTNVVRGFAAPDRPPVDLNGDGIGDVVWQNEADDQFVAWLYDAAGQVIPGAERLLGGSGGWELEVVGDFDGDPTAVSDLVWRHQASGATYLWVMNADGTAAEERWLGGDLDWRVEASGDYDGDGRTDLIWRQTSTGASYLSLMEGATARETRWIGGDQSWRLVPTAANYDANGDLRTDLIWNDDRDGANVVHLMNGSARLGEFPLATPGGASIAATGDYNADGFGDLIWHWPLESATTPGRTEQWLMGPDEATGSWRPLIRQDLPAAAGSEPVQTASFWNAQLAWVDIGTGSTAAWTLEGSEAPTDQQRNLGGNAVWRLLGRGLRNRG